jgi:hypothetical protein
MALKAGGSRSIRPRSVVFSIRGQVNRFKNYGQWEAYIRPAQRRVLDDSGLTVQCLGGWRCGNLARGSLLTSRQSF